VDPNPDNLRLYDPGDESPVTPDALRVTCNGVSVAFPQRVEFPWMLEPVPGLKLTVRSRPGVVRRTLLRWLLGFRWLPNQ